MKITASSQNFTSRNQYVRKADDIVRKVRQEFPMFSPSYAASNWDILKNSKLEFRELLKFGDIYGTKMKKIRQVGCLSPQNPCFSDIFQKAINEKVGNCREYSSLTLGALFANGYNNAVKIIPSLNIKVYDASNNEIFSHFIDCDHVAVMTKMSQAKNVSDVVVLDSWLGKAMSFHEARIEYETLFKEQEISNAIRKTKSAMIKKHPLNIFKKYKYVCKICFIGSETEIFEPKLAAQLGQKIAQEFPQVKMN